MNKFIPFLSVFFLGCLLFCGCEDNRNFLGPDQEEINANDYFNNQEAFDKAVLGTYQKLTFFYNYRRGGENWLHDIRLLPDDDATTSRTNEFELFYRLSPLNSNLEDYYQFAYQLIARANTVLMKQDQFGDQAYTDQTLRNTHRGEVLFLRGWMNFMLWNVFGTAPLVEKRILSTDDFFPPNSTENELLNHAIADMEIARELLPTEWPVEMAGRVTQNSANGLLGKMLLYRATITQIQADYLAAIGAFDNIQGVSLTAKFGDNFDENLEDGPESIFEIHLGDNEVPQSLWLSNDDFDYGDVSGYWGFFDNNFSQFGIPPYTATTSLINVFEPDDPRIPSTFDPATREIKKYVERPRATGNSMYYNNARVLRYADVLLMKAEAIVQSGGSLSEAITLVNQIRERARNSSDTTSLVPADLDVNQNNSQTVLQWIMDERRRELAFEEHRWYDLRRWHLGGIIDLDTLDFSSDLFDPRFEVRTHLLFPLPASQVAQNPNLEQNPGY
ncbi:MAG: RagB/SusD family nutrient uptake outer membrane protein [Bacteroidia bacterium]